MFVLKTANRHHRYGGNHAVLAGTSEGGSPTHYYYIGVEVILFIALVLLAITVVRGVLLPTHIADDADHLTEQSAPRH